MGSTERIKGLGEGLESKRDRSSQVSQCADYLQDNPDHDEAGGRYDEINQYLQQYDGTPDEQLAPPVQMVSAGNQVTVSHTSFDKTTFENTHQRPERMGPEQSRKVNRQMSLIHYQADAT